jgi:hypothetical protein
VNYGVGRNWYEWVYDRFCDLGSHPVLTSLLHGATATHICDQDSLNQELEFLTTVFKNS